MHFLLASILIVKLHYAKFLAKFQETYTNLDIDVVLFISYNNTYNFY